MDRITGRHERSDGAPAIAAIAVFLLSEDGLGRNVFAPLSQFGMTAAGALHGVGGDEELALGVRKNNGALIAPFGHDVSLAGYLTLEFDESTSHCGIGSNGLPARKPTWKP